MSSFAPQEVPAGSVAPVECPFCGAFHARILEFESSAFYVRCRLCLGAGPVGPSPNSAALAWNNRPMVAQLRKLLADETDSILQDGPQESPEAQDFLTELAGQI